MKDMKEPLSYEKVGNYAEFSVGLNSQMVIRTFGYADSYHYIARFELKKDLDKNEFYISYYLNKRLSEKMMHGVKYYDNGTVEITVHIPEINEHSTLYYRDLSGDFFVNKGDEKSWERYLDKRVTLK